jgi:hypothetical protein
MKHSAVAFLENRVVMHSIYFNMCAFRAFTNSQRSTLYVHECHSGASNGRHDMGGPGRCFFYIDNRLAVFRRLSVGARRQVLRSVHGEQRVQLPAADRLFLGYNGSHVRTVRRNLPGCTATASQVTRPSPARTTASAATVQSSGKQRSVTYAAHVENGIDDGPLRNNK